MLGRLAKRAREVLSAERCLVFDGGAIQEFMRMEVHGYEGAKTAALPLGMQAGLPDRAACVDTSEVLRGFDEVVAPHASTQRRS